MAQQLQEAVAHLTPQLLTVAGAPTHFGRHRRQQAGQKRDAALGLDLGLDLAFDVLEALLLDDADVKPLQHRVDEHRVRPQRELSPSEGVDQGLGQRDQQVAEAQVVDVQRLCQLEVVDGVGVFKQQCVVAQLGRLAAADMAPEEHRLHLLGPGIGPQMPGRVEVEGGEHSLAAVVAAVMLERVMERARGIHVLPEIEIVLIEPDAGFGHRVSLG